MDKKRQQGSLTTEKRRHQDSGANSSISAARGPPSAPQSNRLEVKSFAKVLLILPKTIPFADDHEQLQEKAALLANKNLSVRLYPSADANSTALLSMGAPSKAIALQGVNAAVKLFSQQEDGLTGHPTLPLVQVPRYGRDNFKLRLEKFKDGNTRLYRHVLDLIPVADPDDPEPKPEVEPPAEAAPDVQDNEFTEYTIGFLRHFDQVVGRLRSVPDFIHMRINFGLYMQFSKHTKGMDLTSFREYEKMVRRNVAQNKFSFNKDLSFQTAATDALEFARRIRLAIQESPDIFAPADNRAMNLVGTPLEETVVVFTSELRLEMNQQVFTNRGKSQEIKQELMQPAIFKEELKNKEKTILSVNPEGLDWDLEILVKESPDKLSEFFKNMNRHIVIGRQQGTLFPRISNTKIARGAGVKFISTKSSRTYRMDEVYNVELAVYIDWDVETGRRLSESCAVSMYALDWLDWLDEKRDIAFSPRNFGPANSNLLPVGPDDMLHHGGSKLMRAVRKVQDFLERVRRGEVEKPDDDYQAPAAPGPPAQVAASAVAPGAGTTPVAAQGGSFPC